MGDEVRVLSYNFFLRPFLIKNNVSDYKSLRLSLLFEQIMQYDVVCLQEVFGIFTNRKEILLEKSLHYGFEYFAGIEYPGLLSKFVIDSGLLTLSKHQIIDEYFQKFTFGYKIDGINTKGFLYTKIFFKGNHLHIINTHMQASYYSGDNDSDGYYRICRLIQLKEIFEFVKNKILKNDLFILCGDFNIDANESPVDIIQYNLIKDKIEQNYNCIYSKIFLNSNVVKEYELCMLYIKEILKDIRLVDVGNLQLGKYVTFGDSAYDDTLKKYIPLETVLINKHDYNSMQCLDYFLAINYDNSNIKVKENSFIVNKFFVSNNKVTQLSDHYGVEITLIINN